MKFLRKNNENWWNWKMSLFLFGHVEKKISKKKFFFCFIPMKTCQSLLVSKDFSKFWWLPWFPAPNSTCLNICNTYGLKQPVFFTGLAKHGWRQNFMYLNQETNWWIMESWFNLIMFFIDMVGLKLLVIFTRLAKPGWRQNFIYLKPETKFGWIMVPWFYLIVHLLLATQVESNQLSLQA